MAHEHLRISSEEGIATLVLDRPAAYNALNLAMLAELEDAFGELGRDEAVRVIVLTGAGEKAFCAGADIGELAPLDAKGARRQSERGQALMERIGRLGKPVIAAINGVALGGGFELALACSFRTASSRARMGLPEVGLGILPGYGGTQRLPRQVGLGRAMRMILTGEPVRAEEAFRIGLVEAVFPPGELLEETRRLAGTIAARPPWAVRWAMESVAAALDLPLREGLRVESDLFGLCASTEDMHEGMRAFLDKRPPRFQGR